MRVCDVRPGRDAVDAAAVLVRDGGADVGELAVLEDEEVVLCGEGAERRREVGDGGGRGECDDVDVRFYEADLGAEFWLGGVLVVLEEEGGGGRGTVDEGEDLGGVCEVGGDAEVGLFAGHDGEEAAADLGRVRFGTGLVGAHCVGHVCV